MPKTAPSWLTALLALALLVSLAFHGLALVSAPTGPRAIALRVEGPPQRPAILVDFDSTMIAPASLEVPLEPGLVALDPPVGATARFLTARRLEIRPLEDLPPFTTCRVRFGPHFADVLGRPFDAEGGTDLAFPTRELGLLGAPTPWIDADGRAVCELHLSGPVEPEAIRKHLDVLHEDVWETPFVLEGEGDTWRVVLPSPPSEPVTIVLHAGLGTRAGPEGLRHALRYEVRWEQTLRTTNVEVEGQHPHWTVILHLSRALASKEVASYVTTEPPVEGLKVQARAQRLVLTGRFPPRRSVDVRLRKGLEAVGGLRLEEDLVRTVTIPAPEARLALAQAGRTLSTAARPEIEIEGVNVPAVEVTLHEVYPSNVVPLALGWTRAPRLASEGVTRRIVIDAPLDEPWTRPLDLEDLLGRPPRGVYQVRVSTPQSWWHNDTRVIQVTDLAPIVRIRPEGIVVRVTTIADGTPVPNAEVEVYDAKNQRRGQGVTDADGLFRGGPLGADAAVVTVRTADDLAYVDLDVHGVTHAPKDIEGRPEVRGLEAFAWVDRGAVRPGEVAHVGAIVRTPAGVAPPAGLPVRLELKGPDQRLVLRRAHRLDDHGMLADDLAFGLDARTGAYTLEVRPVDGEEAIGSTAFRVEAIVPDRIEPALALPKGDLAAGAVVPVGVSARLLTGEPAPGLNATLVVRYRPVDAADADGFTFGDADAAPEPFETRVAAGTLDADGRRAVELRLPEANPAGVALEATFELEVIDVSGRGAFARTTRRVLPGGGRLGLGVPSGEAFVLPVTTRGAATARGEGVLERLTWRGGWVVEGARFTWRSERVPVEVERAPFVVTDGRGRLAFADPGNGLFRVRVEAEGCAPASVRFARWSGRTEAAARDAGAPRLDVALVGSGATPGQAATLAVDAPFGGRGLLTLEGGGVFEARAVDVPAGRSEIAIEVPAAQGPIVYAALTVVRGAREAGDEPTRLLGAARIALDRPERRLAVEIDAPPEILPEDTLRVRVRTSAPAGVRVHVVDEGVLRLTGYETPSPLACFEAPRRLDTILADAHAALLQRMRFGGNDAEPGGGEAFAKRLDPTAAKTIETVALASALVTCDGEIELSFPLPAWEGRLRVFAVAAHEAATGSAEAAVVVKGPIGLSLHVPRAVAPGDVFDVLVDARGDGVALDVEVEGLERLGGDHRLRVRALDTPGVARVTVTAQDAHGNRTTRTARLSIRPPAPFTVRHDVRRFEAGAQVEEALPGRWHAGTARARITVGMPGVLDALPAMERLLEYPHGCIEQTLSRAYPVLALAELFRLANPEGERAPDTVGDAIDRLRLMQTASGGLAYWPGNREPYAFGSAYGASFLLEAKAAGRVVPDDLLKPLLDWLEARLRGDRGDAYTARVLAQAGRPVASFLDALERKAVDRRVGGMEDLVHLAAAWLLVGEPERANALLAKVGDPWAAPRETGGSLSSPKRAAATLLAALVEVRPDDARIGDLVLRLEAAGREAMQNTTQENAAVLLALAKAERLRRTTQAATHGWIEVGGRTTPFDGSTPLVVDVSGTDPWSYRLYADGPVTLVLRTEGIPLDVPEAPVNQALVVARRIEGAAGPLKQGQVFRVSIEGYAPPGSQSVLLTDVLPGGLEIEAARNQEGTFTPDRIEPRDDRVLFFRTEPLTGAFRQTYLVRAVTPGTYHLPPVRAELLYDPTQFAQGPAGDTLEVVR